VQAQYKTRITQQDQEIAQMRQKLTVGSAEKRPGMQVSANMVPSENFDPNNTRLNNAGGNFDHY